VIIRIFSRSDCLNQD